MRPLKTFLAVLFTSLFWFTPAGGEELSISPEVDRLVQAALRRDDGTATGRAAALGMLDKRLEALKGDAEQDQADRSAVALGGASIAFRAGDPGRAAAYLAVAADAARRTAGRQADAARLMELRAGMVVRTGDRALARSLLEDAYQYRKAHMITVSDDALGAAAMRLNLALAEGADHALQADLDRIAPMTAFSGLFDPLRLLDAQVAIAGAEKRMGRYDAMRETVLLGGQTAGLLSASLSLGDPDTQARKAAICQAIDLARRNFAGLAISTGDLGDATPALRSLDSLEECREEFAGAAGRYRLSVGARLALESGEALAAERRALAFAEASADSRDDLDRVIADLRLARARTQLGFVERAGQALSDGLSTTPFSDDTLELERLLALAAHRDLTGSRQEALDHLEAAAQIAAKAPHDWLPQAEVAFRRAYLLAEGGDLAQSRAVRDRFERVYSKVARPVSSEARFPSEATMRLERLRLLHDLMLALAEADGKNVASLVAKWRTVQPPGAPDLRHHAQRAWGEACLLLDGPQVCDIDAAFHLPFNLAYAPTHLSLEMVGPYLSGDRFRYGAIRARLFEPFMMRLWAASQTERAKASAGGFDTEGTARVFARTSGGSAAFVVAQRLIEGGAETAVSQIGERLAAGDDRLSASLRRRFDLSDRIASVADDDRSGTRAKMLEELRVLDEAIGRDFPEYRASFEDTPVYVHQLAQLLAEDEALLLIVTSDTASYAFAATRDDFDWHRAPIGQDDLEGAVRTLRSALDPSGAARAAKTIGMVPQAGGFDRNLAHRLYRELLEPLEPVFEGRELKVAIQGPLAALPLSVLVTDPPSGDNGDPAALRATAWLARSHALTVLPSPSVLRLETLRTPRPVLGGGFVGLGDPTFAIPADAVPAQAGRGFADRSRLAGLVSLPGTRREVEGLSRLFAKEERTTVLLGREASEAGLKRADLSKARVIALATHGLTAGEAGTESEPGLALALPARQDQTDDGFLTASEAAALDMDAEWLLLSACNTAADDGHPDSTGLSGLVRAFLFAGARTIMASHWPVRDDAAALLTVRTLEWHRDNPRSSKAEALRQAMLTLMDGPPELAAPSAWAPFVLVGESD